MYLNSKVLLPLEQLFLALASYVYLTGSASHLTGSSGPLTGSAGPGHVAFCFPRDSPDSSSCLTRPLAQFSLPQASFFPNLSFSCLMTWSWGTNEVCLKDAKVTFTADHLLRPPSLRGQKSHVGSPSPYFTLHIHTSDTRGCHWSFTCHPIKKPLLTRARLPCLTPTSGVVDR